MIKTFRCKGTEKLFNGQNSSRYKSISKIAIRKLQMLDTACDVSDLRAPPGSHLENLSGDRSGQYSIHINKKWRICFKYSAGDVFAVEIVDYH